MQIECIKCKAWDMAAKESGHSGGMCEECFKKYFVSFQPERTNPEDGLKEFSNPDLLKGPMPNLDFLKTKKSICDVPTPENK